MYLTNDTEPDQQILANNPHYTVCDAKLNCLLVLLYKLDIEAILDADTHGYVNRVIGIKHFISISEANDLASDYKLTRTDIHSSNDYRSLRYRRTVTGILPVK